jgi:hypothetical protein
MHQRKKAGGHPTAGLFAFTASRLKARMLDGEGTPLLI